MFVSNDSLFDNNEEDRMQKDMGLACFKALVWNLSGGPEETLE
jgi:hypothetical protein